MKKYILYPLMLCGIMSACVEDKTTFADKELNSISIDSIQSSYNGMAYFDTLRVNPTVTGSLLGDDQSKYEYLWYICRGSHRHDTISTSMNLEWKMDVAPGTYSLYLSVKDKETGLDHNQGFSLIASSPFTRGFLILGNRPGTDKLVGVDMLSMPAGRDTVYIEDAFDNSTLQLKGAERLLLNSMSDNLFFITTESGDYKVTFSSAFEPIAELNDLGIIEPLVPHKIPMKLLDIGDRRYAWLTYKSTGSIYSRVFVTEDFVYGGAGYSPTYNNPMNTYDQNSGEYFRFYPRVFYQTGRTLSGYTNSAIVLYDLDHECFSYANNYSVTQMGQMGENYALTSTGLWMNNKALGRTIVYGENDCMQTYGFVNTIMKDQQGRYYIYHFRPTWSYPTRPGNESTSGAYLVDLSVAENFDKAENYYFAGYTTVMFYSVGNRLYQYNYVTKKIGYKDFDGDITYLEGEHASPANGIGTTMSSYGSNRWFWIATYDGSKGKIYKYEVANNPNEMEFNQLPGQQWDINLEVKSIVWKLN